MAHPQTGIVATRSVPLAVAGGRDGVFAPSVANWFVNPARPLSSAARLGITGA
jgi:hypothetical protein